MTRFVKIDLTARVIFFFSLEIVPISLTFHMAHQLNVIATCVTFNGERLLRKWENNDWIDAKVLETLVFLFIS